MKAFLTHPLTITLIKIIISAGLITGIIYYIDFQALTISFLNADTLFISVGIALAVLQLFVHFFRWRYLLRLVSADISNQEVFTSLFVGFMAGFFTPAQLGEFAGRIASHPTVNRAHIIGITFMDKVYWMILTIVIGGSGLVVFMSVYMAEYWHPVYSIVSASVIIFLTGLYLNPEYLKPLLQMLPERIRGHRYYEMVIVLEERFHNSQGRVLFGLTALIYAMILLEYYFLAISFGPVPFSDAIMCGASVFFVKSIFLPISFGDLGIRESAAVFFFERAGSTAAIAFNASIVMSFANIIIPNAIGAVMMLRLKRKQ